MRRRRKTLPIEEETKKNSRADHNKSLIDSAFITFLRCINIFLKTKLNNWWELHKKKTSKRRRLVFSLSSSSSFSTPKSLIIDLKFRFYLHFWLSAITHRLDYAGHAKWKSNSRSRRDVSIGRLLAHHARDAISCLHSANNLLTSSPPKAWQIFFAYASAWSCLLAGVSSRSFWR